MGKKQKSNGYGDGTFVEASVFLSPAFLSLGNKGTAPTVSTASVKILMLLLGKRQFKTVTINHKKKRMQTDENKFTLTYKELENRGIKQGIATRGIDELLAKGFISIVDPGGAFEKHKAVYALEDNYLLWRYDPKSKEPPPVIYQRQRDIRRGFQNSKNKNKTNIAHVNEGHPHTRQSGTPPKKTRTSTGDTPILDKMEVTA